MRTQATNRSAAAAGAVIGLLMYFVGPQIDAAGPASSIWLVVCAAAFSFATYFYVLGAPTEDRAGLWILSPPLLKRVGACFLAAGVVLALATACSYVTQFVGADRCLDSGGRWNYQNKTCEH
jgi:hypothetical protein